MELLLTNTPLYLMSHEDMKPELSIHVGVYFLSNSLHQKIVTKKSKLNITLDTVTTISRASNCFTILEIN